LPQKGRYQVSLLLLLLLLLLLAVLVVVVGGWVYQYCPHCYC
jgi:hypothetical protein